MTHLPARVHPLYHRTVCLLRQSGGTHSLSFPLILRASATAGRRVLRVPRAFLATAFCRNNITQRSRIVGPRAFLFYFALRSFRPCLPFPFAFTCSSLPYFPRLHPGIVISPSSPSLFGLIRLSASSPSASRPNFTAQAVALLLTTLRASVVRYLTFQRISRNSFRFQAVPRKAHFSIIIQV